MVTRERENKAMLFPCVQLHSSAKTPDTEKYDQLNDNTVHSNLSDSKISTTPSSVCGHGNQNAAVSPAAEKQREVTHLCRHFIVDESVCGHCSCRTTSKLQAFTLNQQQD